jgi:hypothetical protein
VWKKSTKVFGSKEGKEKVEVNIKVQGVWQEGRILILKLWGVGAWGFATTFDTAIKCCGGSQPSNTPNYQDLWGRFNRWSRGQQAWHCPTKHHKGFCRSKACTKPKRKLEKA